ncbi:MAG: DUF971 domain-containing protein [SAR324 cluster bacterium]|nr:DUF971 domain-containing protein [SAR324 cluster bacterium]
MTSLKQKKPEKILIADDLYILWKDGHESRYIFFQLRNDCPCAVCIDELTGKKVLKPETIPVDIHIRHSEYVGNYAFRIHWSDGHNSGLYTFKSLRDKCACSICKASPLSSTPV